MEGYDHPLSNSNYNCDFLYLLSSSLSDLILYTVELEALTPPSSAPPPFVLQPEMLGFVMQNLILIFLVVKKKCLILI